MGALKINEQEDWKEEPMDEMEDQSGRIGYLIAWFLGVPVSILFIVFLIRGH